MTNRTAIEIALHTTVGFVQVWLEVVSIGINNIAALVRAWPTSPNIGSKYLSLSKSRAAVTGGRNPNAIPAQSPNVVRQLTADYPNIQTEYWENLFFISFWEFLFWQFQS